MRIFSCPKRSFWAGLVLHLVVVVGLFSLLFVVRWDRAGQPELPLLPKVVIADNPGRYFAWMLGGVASDQSLYYAESDYLLHGVKDPKFTNYYKTQGEEAVGRWRLPYRDLAFEYPPLAIPFVVLPGLFASTLYDYKVAFSLMAAFFFLGTVWTAAKIHGRPDGLFLAGSLAFVIAFGPIIISRFDVFAVFFVVMALRAAQMKRSAQAGVWLALGVAIKLYPLVFLPFFLLYAYRTVSFKGGLKLLLGFTAALALIYVPVLAVAREGFLDSLRYHSERGVEIESLWASWAEVRHLFGGFAASYVGYGSTNVAWAGEAWVMKFWTYFALSALAAAGLPFFFRMVRQGDESPSDDIRLLIQACLAAVLALLITTKVLSNQYILWLYPLFLWAAKKWVWVLYFLAALGSQLIFPYFFNDLTFFDPTAVVILAVRNALLLMLFPFALDWDWVFGGKNRKIDLSRARR